MVYQFVCVSDSSENNSNQKIWKTLVRPENFRVKKVTAGLDKMCVEIETIENNIRDNLIQIIKMESNKYWSSKFSGQR